jgi:hypothetical protein
MQPQIGNQECAQIATRLLVERPYPLDGVDLLGHLRQHRRLIAAAGTDL